MIPISKDFNLGRDTKTMKDPADGLRQTRTVEEILRRFFTKQERGRKEIQILADEVGMGKTFVALGVAYSILRQMNAGGHPDLDGCYKRILVVTPSNSSLFKKWVREVDEFASRCVDPNRSGEVTFKAQEVLRLDDLGTVLRKGGKQPQVVVARMGLLGSDRLESYELKRMFTLKTLFRHWGVRFSYDQRDRLLRGAPDEWRSLIEQGFDPDTDNLPFSEDELLSLIQNFSAEASDTVESLWELCRELATPYYRDRSDEFDQVRRKLVEVYRLASLNTINRAFPLMIVDEAHHWKNGPDWGTNCFREFAEHIFPHVRRALLLTATPFQLRPGEMLNILKISDYLQPRSTIQESKARTEKLAQFRDKSLLNALNDAEHQSRVFSKAWSALPESVTTEALRRHWQGPSLLKLRETIRANLDLESGDQGSVTDETKRALALIDPNERAFINQAIQLLTANHVLSKTLGQVVIRHKRRTEHRRFRIGSEYVADVTSLNRQDQHLLHPALGLDVRGEAELPQFLLMRSVSEMKGGKGRASLGADLTGCYSTLLDSAEGRNVQNSLSSTARGRKYLDLLLGMVNEKHDAKHPKMKSVVDEAVVRWRQGEKMLIFCVRVKTAERLRDLIDERIQSELKLRRKRCLGGEEQVKSLLSRVSGRDRDLVVLGLDRVLWSLAWSDPSSTPLRPDQFKLTDEELRELATLGLRFGVDVVGEKVDRVFLFRATEHILASRIAASVPRTPLLGAVLEQMVRPEWISAPYGGIEAQHEDSASEDAATFDERGSHTVYAPEREPRDDDVQALWQRIVQTRRNATERDQRAVVDGYAYAPSVWFGSNPQEAWEQRSASPSRTIVQIHEFLAALSQRREPDWGVDLLSRALVLQALRRTVLRQSVLLRLLPEKSAREESGWGELLAEAFFSLLPEQHESLADRVCAFLEHMESSSGAVHGENSSRATLLQATKLRGSQFVALVKGGGGTDTRERVFAGFNTPLLPEILVCTGVGQEGIDLHRHCRHVVHYDLPWNPAVMEQRTGRTDRLGSKTFRERERNPKVMLDVGVPFLGGTYDERVFEELRLRAQTFEVLTGGEFTAEHVDDEDVQAKPGVTKSGLASLPNELLHDLRVKLEVSESNAAQEGG